MSSMGKGAVVMATIWCLGTTALAARRTNLFILVLPLALVLASAAIVSLLCILIEWEGRRWRALLPLTTCIVAVFGCGILIQGARRLVFAWTFPSYERVVARMESGAIPVSTNLQQIPAAETEARWVFDVRAEKDDKGVVKAWFFTEMSFPVKHSGYFYCTAGVSESDTNILSRWPIAEKIRDQWLYVSD